jgi:hypothetical protein
MNVIIFNHDGRLAVLNPSPSWKGTLHELAAKDIGATAEYAIVDDTALPDAYFRDAWRFENGEAAIDAEAAKEIQRDRWREARAPLLAALDVEFMRAVETQDTEAQAAIATQKQDLRDVTETALPNEPSLIKSVWPEVLGPRP